MSNLDPYELEVLDAYESGKLKPIASKPEFQRMRAELVRRGRKAVVGEPRRLKAQDTTELQPASATYTFCTSSWASMAARKVSTSSSCTASRLAGATGFFGL